MDKLTIIEKLIDSVRAGNLDLGMDKEETDRMLNEIRLRLQVSLYDEVVEYITAYTTGYYAPEYENWKEFLGYCFTDDAMVTVLMQEFTQEEIEELWQNSHVVEELNEKQIKETLISEIVDLKAAMLISCKASENPEIFRRFFVGKKARIQGLFNILFE